MALPVVPDPYGGDTSYQDLHLYIKSRLASRHRVLVLDMDSESFGDKVILPGRSHKAALKAELQH